MAGFSSSRHARHRGLRIPDLRTGDDSPLSTSLYRSLLATCCSRRLSTQRIRHCGLSVTFQIRSQPCADGWPMRSSGPCNDVRVAGAGRKTSIVVYAYDAVRLERDELGWGVTTDRFSSRAPDASRTSAASGGPFYFAWGCFRDFVSGLPRCTAEEALRCVRDTRSSVRKPVPTFPDHAI